MRLKTVTVFDQSILLLVDQLALKFPWCKLPVTAINQMLYISIT